jgi:hypothetical protein
VNGVKTNLNPPGALYSRIYATAVSDGKFYAAGGYDSYDAYGVGIRTSCYWVDGERFDIFDGNKRAFDYYIEAMAIEKGKLYFAGLRFDDTDELLSCYWVDDKVTDFPYYDSMTSGPIRGSRITQLAVENGKVYASGSAYEEGNNFLGSDGIYYAGYRACYWTQTKMIDLHPPGAGYSYAEDIAVVNGEVRVLGYFTTFNSDGTVSGATCYWVDGKLYLLSGDDPRPNSMVVKNGKVYIVGKDYTPYNGYRACVWIDGERIFLNGDSAEAITFAQ